jgi:hypothetical protein
VAERPIASVLKTDNIERCSRVRIPPPPLLRVRLSSLTLRSLSSRPGCRPVSVECPESEVRFWFLCGEAFADLSQLYRPPETYFESMSAEGVKAAR